MSEKQRCIDCHAFYKKYDLNKGEEVNACHWGRMSEGDLHYADPSVEMNCGGYFQPKKPEVVKDIQE